MCYCTVFALFVLFFCTCRQFPSDKSLGTYVDMEGPFNGGFFVLEKQGLKFIFGLGSTCATRCKFLGALAKF